MTKKAPGSGDELLADWFRRIREAQFAHYQSAKPLVRANYLLGVPVVALSALVGTSIFATLQEQADVGIRIAVGIVSVLAAFLSGLQTFLRFSEGAEKHRGVATRYGALRREIEMIQATNMTADPKKLDEVRERFDSISMEAPEISDATWKRTEAILKKRQ